MTEFQQRAAEVDAYQRAVEGYLTDLPVGERAEMVADLEAHLQEVVQELEPGASLVGRLGTPAHYARELREAAGVGAPPAPVRVDGAADGLAPGGLPPMAAAPAAGSKRMPTVAKVLMIVGFVFVGMVLLFMAFAMPFESSGDSDVIYDEVTYTETAGASESPQDDATNGPSESPQPESTDGASESPEADAT